MNLLTIDHVGKAYRDHKLLSQASGGISREDKIGVIGINGTGKSTLLKIIAGLEAPDEGNVTKGNQVRMAYLAQNPYFEEGLSVLEYVCKGVKAREEHWNLEGEAKAMLLKLGISDSSADPFILSGGQRKRAALVKTLLTPADILVLDEPTNHLDHEMSEWLEEYLKKFNGALVMVTHDRYFLNRVTNKIWEIDKGALYSYPDTDYTGYLLRKAEREESVLAAERKNKSLYKKDLEWMMRGARARSTKQKAHIERFQALRDRERPAEEKKIELNPLGSRLGKKIIELNNIGKGFGEQKLIARFTYIFLSGDRVGIVGPNGCGKTTLLNIIAGCLMPEEGAVDKGATVRIGYFAQENEVLDPNKTVMDYIRNVAEYIEASDGRVTAAKMLERFLFSGELAYSPIEKLSGGEKRRLYLLRVLMDAPNVLILDEPTNDLDIQTLSVLEDYLDSFNGVVITVSHDRYFLDRVVNRIFAFEENGRIRQYEGGFTDYANARAGRQKPSQALKEKPVGKKTGSQERRREERLKFSYQEQRDFDTIEDEINAIEERLETLNQQMEKESSNYVKLEEIVREKQQVEAMLEEKMERWMYLNDLAERIQTEKTGR